MHEHLVPVGQQHIPSCYKSGHHKIFICTLVQPTFTIS